MKRWLAISVAWLRANLVQLLHIHQGWCVYQEFEPGWNWKFRRVTFIGLCTGSLATHSLVIKRRYFGTSMFDYLPKGYRE